MGLADTDRRRDMGTIHASVVSDVTTGAGVVVLRHSPDPAPCLRSPRYFGAKLRAGKQMILTDAALKPENCKNRGFTEVLPNNLIEIIQG